MSELLTLVAATALTDEVIAAFAGKGDHASTDRIDDRAADLVFATTPDMAGIRALADNHKVDYALQDPAARQKKLLIADMDSTMIEQECLDELAAAVGIGEEIAAITERAMRGELDFEEALRTRVARLEGVDGTLREDVIRDRLTLSPGARTLIQTARKAGMRTVLVSGGFDLFVGAIAEQCGFDAWHANTLELDDEGRLTGNVIPPILGREAKAQYLKEEAAIAGASPVEAAAMGDGANDLGMIELAGLGVAYKAKPVVAEAADASIRHTDLTALLYFLGIVSQNSAA